VTDAVDPLRIAAERLHDAILDARRVGGDAVVCDAFEMLGAVPGQQRYRYAAAAIRGLPPGRPADDDDDALQRILKFPESQHRDAVGIVARDMAREVVDVDARRKRAHANACRFRRKLKEKHNIIL
jgi:hypothetical protein